MKKSNFWHKLVKSIYIYIYINSYDLEKSNYILIEFSILCHVSHLIFNFVSNELLNVKIEEYKSNEIQNWISIGVQFSSMCPNKFLIFVISELLGVKIEESKTN